MMLDRNTLHRGSKIFLDSGKAASPDQAIDILKGFRLACLVGPEIARSATLQAALLTAVNLAHRSFLGGVTVHGLDTGVPLLTSLPGVGTLGEAVVQWGGRLSMAETLSVPTLVFGSPTVQAAYPQALQVTFDGWITSVSPIRDQQRLAENDTFPVAGIAAAALAVSEAFQHLCGEAEAMRRAVTLSLWDPAQDNASGADRGPGNNDMVLPQKVWILGLGHLGQAFLWALLALPYREPEKMTLVLHDFDTATEANISTSILTAACDVGTKKTRFLVPIAEARGFQTIIQERPFNAHLKVAPDDPALLLCGVDSPRVRQQIEGAGFSEIIEAGIGDAEDYLDFQIHSFPAAHKAEQVWANVEREARSDRLLRLPSYQKMQAEGLDVCGLVQVAEAAVGVPFVGAYVASLVVAEAVRAAMMGPRQEIISGSLGTPCHHCVVPRHVSIDAKSIGFLPASDYSD